jgi:hypothetical protein
MQFAGGLAGRPGVAALAGRVRRPVLWLALRLGENGRVVSSASLVAEVREAATAALAHYAALHGVSSAQMRLRDPAR